MENTSFTRSGNIVDLVQMRIFPGTIKVVNGKIISVKEEAVKENCYVLPGLIDAHIHIESSMLIPSEFARLAVRHGTVATVSDPHEIANVLGVEGIKFMIRNGNKVPFKFFFGASSCVPATVFETAGARLGVEETEELMRMPEIKYMSEMMNFPGVLFGDKEVLSKLALAKKYNKPVDGHAPGVLGEDARRYIEAGISTDHECFTMEEALEKIRYGMKILIREGSAARNFDALVNLLKDHADKVMFCSDDRHPDDLERRHMNDIVKRAIAKGYDPLVVLRSCILNPVKHYGLEVGLLQQEDAADFILVDNLEDFNVQETFVDGMLVASMGKTLIDSVPEEQPNKFNANQIRTEDIAVFPAGNKIRVIEALEGQLITHDVPEMLSQSDGNLVSKAEQDVLKMIVLNRYNPAPPAVAFVKSFGLKKGAIASTVAHDSHNIIAVGTTDEEIIRAVNALIESKGGICCVEGRKVDLLPLPVAGLMSDKDGFEVAAAYEKMDGRAKEFGSQLRAPFMTLSFMALLVIPELKLSDKGLFDGNKFDFTSLFIKS